ncbi:VENN motif pre-toxin domain-containing protein [Pantoea sp.]|uniref:VENN motif pre-toxin domain-containing protein n=1 Tax=Pantoea sp. TaxID=69393 RepID=UPI0028AB70E8|nr:VENN motif pre-toxin domain-containing protein [Pantoea sp.]
MSTGGGIGGQFAGNMANGMLAGLNGSGSASSVTKSAVSEGTIVIRDKEKQTQDVADLSRDVANANPGLDVIFDKEREQNRLKAAQLIGEIGAQAGDIARTQGQIAGMKAQQDPAALNAVREQLAASGRPYTESDVTQRAYDNAMKPFGTGSSLQQGISAVTAAVQGLSGGNLAQAVSGASAPYLAEKIHALTTDANGKVNVQANLMAHAVLGAVTSYAAGNAALAGASGAVMGEYIAQQLYPGVKREDLSEEQRQTISALGTLAAGLAGGVAGDSTADAVAGAQAGKNAVEQNHLHVSEKTELELAKQKLQKSNDPAEREQAQQKINELNELDISRDKKVLDACGNGNAGSAACAGARLGVIAVKGEYETGSYNSKISQQYADAYGNSVNLLNITSVDAQNQQQVKDAMVNYAMQMLALDKATAEQYISTYDGMKSVAASVSPVLGNASASKLSSLTNKVVSNETAQSSQIIKSYGPHESGPFGNPSDQRATASTFRSGTYTEKVAETDIYLYRDYGGSARADGRFWTPEPSKGPLQSQMDSAVLPEWGNTFQNQAIIKIPKGTKYYEGNAAAQTGTEGTHPTLHGGGTQIFLPTPNNEWIIKK